MTCQQNSWGLLFQGMDHNQGLTDDKDIARYIKRDLRDLKSKAGLPYEIRRDEVVGR